MWKFKKEYRDAVISIPALRLNINRFNLTDELAEKVRKKYPQAMHNLTQDPALMDERDRGGEVVNLPKTKLADTLDSPVPDVPMIEQAGGDLEYPVVKEEDPSDKKPDMETGIIGAEAEETAVEEKPKKKSNKTPKPKGVSNKGKGSKGTK